MNVEPRLKFRTLSWRSSPRVFFWKTLFNFRKDWLSVVGSSGLEPPTLRLSGVRSNHLSYEPISVRVAFVLISSPFGGDEEDRTPDPLRARQVLSQLSYTPISGFRICRSYLHLRFFLKTLKIEQHHKFLNQVWPDKTILLDGSP